VKLGQQEIERDAEVMNTLLRLGVSMPLSIVSVTHPTYAADPTGVADSLTDIQAAIDADSAT
jgi:hypothetical protein